MQRDTNEQRRSRQRILIFPKSCGCHSVVRRAHRVPYFTTFDRVLGFMALIKCGVLCRQQIRILRNFSFSLSFSLSRARDRSSARTQNKPYFLLLLLGLWNVNYKPFRFFFFVSSWFSKITHDFLNLLLTFLFIRFISFCVNKQRLNCLYSYQQNEENKNEIYLYLYSAYLKGLMNSRR